MFVLGSGIGLRRDLILLVRVQGGLGLLLPQWCFLRWVSCQEISFDLGVLAGVTKWWAMNMAQIGEELSLLLHLFSETKCKLRVQVLNQKS